MKNKRMIDNVEVASMPFYFASMTLREFHIKC